MREKPINPYTRLLREVKHWAYKVMYPRRSVMFRYEKASLGNGWSLADVASKTKTAKNLGWRTEIEINENGDLVIVHYERHPEPSWF